MFKSNQDAAADRRKKATDAAEKNLKNEGKKTWDRSAKTRLGNAQKGVDEAKKTR